MDGVRKEMAIVIGDGCCMSTIKIPSHSFLFTVKEGVTPFATKLTIHINF